MVGLEPSDESLSRKLSALRTRGVGQGYRHGPYRRLIQWACPSSYDLRSKMEGAASSRGTDETDLLIAAGKLDVRQKLVNLLPKMDGGSLHIEFKRCVTSFMASEMNSIAPAIGKKVGRADV